MKLGKPKGASANFAENVNDNGCLWPTNGTDHPCGEQLEKLIKDSGMGYCLKHYKNVVSLREWAQGIEPSKIAA